MNASSKIQSLRDGLAPFFDKPTFIQFTDGDEQVYAGVSASITETIPDPADRGKVILPVTVAFVKIVRVRVAKLYGDECYLPANEAPKPVKGRFYWMRFRIETIKVVPDRKKRDESRTHASVFDNPRESLIFSNLVRDFTRFNDEIFGLKYPWKT